MKSLLAVLSLTTALTIPGVAMARPVTLTAQMTNYGGDGAYFAVYLTNRSGAYAGTLWLAGSRSRYFRHLTEWYRAASSTSARIHGVTGASVGAGRTAKVSLDIADALFDAGYTLHVDAAAENMRESRNEVSLPLTTQGSGKAARGRRYVARFAYHM
ncbi:DUF2271 domain-containing protein [Jiella sp. M17.18]|uniref:DUF2271 domain-containing protein n=1 Tax=Jiella sp. M17.18 TaxID=3234247 RepID=UPI0034DE4496